MQNKSLIELDENKYKIYDSIFKEWLKKNRRKRKLSLLKNKTGFIIKIHIQC